MLSHEKLLHEKRRLSNARKQNNTLVFSTLVKQFQSNVSSVDSIDFSWWDCDLILIFLVEWDPKQYNRNSDFSNQMKFSRPDILLGSNWFGPETERGKHHSTLTDAIGQLLGEDCNFKYSSAAAASSPGQGGGHGSCEWEWFWLLFWFYSLYCNFGSFLAPHLLGEGRSESIVEIYWRSICSYFFSVVM